MVLVSKLRSQLILFLSGYTTQKSPHPVEGSGGCERQGVSVWVADLTSSTGVPDLGRTQPGELHKAALRILPVSERRRPPHSVSVSKAPANPRFLASVPRALCFLSQSPSVWPETCPVFPRLTGRCQDPHTFLPCPNRCLYSPPCPCLWCHAWSWYQYLSCAGFPPVVICFLSCVDYILTG